MDRARTVLEKALSLSPIWREPISSTPKFCAAMAITTSAADHLRKVLAQYPRDRVALNDLGRILFLQRKYADAVKVLESVLAGRSGRLAGALQPDALLQRPGR